MTPPLPVVLSLVAVAVRSVDFRGAIVADLPRGRIETRDRRRLVALPADWFITLLERASGDAVTALGAQLGQILEPDVRAVLDGETEPTPDDVAYALSAAMATRGLGTVSIERWGDALVLVWHDPPGKGPNWNEMAAEITASLVARITGLEVACAPIWDGTGDLRLLLSSRAVCEMARERARQGETLPQILMHLESTAEGA